MIADAPAIDELLFGENSKYQKLKKMILNGKVPLRVPETVRYEVLDSVVKKKAEPEHLQRLLSLVAQFLDCITVEMDADQLSKAAELCKVLDIGLSSAACLVLATSFVDVYITGNISVARKLKKNGYPVLHLSEVFSI
ncbi:hypothetical protein [Archaeoglobus sp.]